MLKILLNLYKKTINILFIFQQAEYSINSLFKWLKSHKNIKNFDYYKKIKITFKIILILNLSFLILFLSFFGLNILLINQNFYLLISIILTEIIVIFILPKYLLFILFSLSELFLRPFKFIIVKILFFLAVLKLKKNKNLKIICISGSGGKTTTKEILNQILRYKFEVLATPENINTQIGISKFILKSDFNRIDFLICEIGAYKKGDIKKITKYFKPKFGILTTINEAHLERFKTIQNTIKAKFEILEYSDIKLANLMNNFIVQEIKKRNWEDKILGYDLIEFAKIREIKDIGTKFYVKNLGEFFTPLIGIHQILNILPGIIISNKFFNYSYELLKEIIKTLKPFKRRFYPIYDKKRDILIIDDSYNGNPEGVEYALKTLKYFKEKRRIIYVTPGIWELGSKKSEILENLGEKIAEIADFSILIKNKNIQFILNGFLKKGYKSYLIIKRENLETELKKILKPKDLIIFQNEILEIKE